MKFSLYRKMSVAEGEKAIVTGRFEKPDNIVYLPRKWFSTSILKTHYFKSPFYNGPTMMVKVEINEEYYRRIFVEGEFLKKEPNGFYGYNESQNDILYARSHKTIPEFYNVGFLDLDTFNKQFDSVDYIDEEKYNEYLERIMLGGSLKDFVTVDVIDSDLDFYFQTSMDVSTLCYKYQTIMPEGIDPIIKFIHFDKDLNRLRKNNLNKFPVTLLVRFKKEFKKYSMYNEFSFSLDMDDIIKYASFIDTIKIVFLEKPKVSGRGFIQIAGDNLYTKHDKVSEPNYRKISFSDFEEITFLLFKKDFRIEDLIYFMPSLKDVDDINQVDPKHIDNLKTHIEKCIKMSNLVVNYYADQGMEFDAEVLVYLKWVLLFHDLGKPYCECLNITSRYSQFGEKDRFRDIVIDQVVDFDMSFIIKSINKLFMASSLCQSKKIKNIIKPLLKEIKEHYQVDDKEAFSYLNKFLKVAFLAKVTHSATLKTRAFCVNYSDDLLFFDRINDLLLYWKDNMIFDYDNYFSDIMGAYEEIIEGFYLDKKHTTLEMVREMLKSDYKDLELIYKSKINHPHILDDNEQYCFDDIICAYFMEDNYLLDKFFTNDIVDNDKHGQIHSERVGVLSYVLGKLKFLSDEDIEILLLASKYHDIGRKIRDDKSHSIESVRLLEDNKVLSESPLRDYVYYLVEAHGFSDKYDLDIMKKYNVDNDRALMLLGIFKDADALDRVRYDTLRNHGSILNIKYLRNVESKKLIKFAYMLNAQYKQNKRNLNPSVKSLLKK